MNKLKLKNMKMRTKLIILFILSGLIPIIVISGFFIIKAGEDMRNTALLSQSLIASNTKEHVSEFYKVTETESTMMVASENIYKELGYYYTYGSNSEEWRQAYTNIEMFLKEAIDNYSYADIFITNKDGVVIQAATNKSDLENVDLSMRDYFEISKYGDQNWSEVFYSEFIDQYVMVLSTPIYSNGNSGDFLGTINILAKQSILNEIAHSEVTKIGETGDAYLIDSTGMLITDTRFGEEVDVMLNSTIDTKVVDVLAKEIEEGNTDFIYEGEYKNYAGKEVFGVLGVTKVGLNYIGVVVEAETSEVFKEISTLQKALLIFIGISVLFGFALAYYISTLISKPIKEIVEETDKISDLDISSNVNQNILSREDEIGNIGKAIHKIQENLRNFITDLSESSRNAAKSSNDLNKTSAVVIKGMDEIASTADEIAHGATSQAERTEQGAVKASELGEIIEKDHEQLKQLVSYSQKVSVLTNEGLEILKDLTEKTNHSSVATKEIHNGILKTQESSDKISEASNVIAAIAEQTNLLALNAAIEAARAGEHGAGFAVVAEEIRKLAEQSTSSTKLIDQMVMELQKNAHNAVETMESVSKTIIEQEESVKNTEEKYLEIDDAIKLSEKAVEDLSKLGEEMESRKDEILSVIEDLSAIAEENAASTQETSAIMAQQQTSLEEIGKSTESLAGVVNELNDIINKFRR